MSVTIADSTNDLKVTYVSEIGTPNVETLTIPVAAEAQVETISVPQAAVKNIEVVTIPIAGEKQIETITIPVAAAEQSETLTIPVVAEAQIEILTFLVTGEAQEETITFPATAGAAQADFILIYNVDGTTVAAWLDIDAAGTVPTNAKYTGADIKTQIDIVTGGSAIENAAIFQTAFGLSGLTDVTSVDNLDGSVTITRDVTGACSDNDPENAAGGGVGSITTVLDNDGVTGTNQGDYVVLTNTDGDTVGVWFDIDAAGVVPTGAAYVATDYQVEVDIVSGGSAIANAGAFETALDLEANFDKVTTTDNGDGTMTLTQTVVGAVDVAVPKNFDDSGVGTITSSTTNLGLDGAVQADYIVVSNVAGVTVAVWLDIDAAGTTPTGAKYVAADYKVEVDIATGASAITNAGAFESALDGEANYTNVTTTDNSDGTITLLQDVVGACDAADPENIDDTGAGSITASTEVIGIVGVAQADYILFSDVAGSTNAMWMDVDAAGTAPSGAKYIASTYQTEINVVTGGTAAAGSAAAKLALDLVTGFNIVTVDNLDGTLTITQSIVGACDDADPENENDTGTGAITTVLTNDGVAGLGQADYVILTNAAGTTVGVWIDVDAVGTAPTGAKFVAADYQVEVDVSNGDSSIANAGAFEVALDLETNFDNVTTTDNGDGTVTLTQVLFGAVAPADPENSDDTDTGAITASTSTVGITGAEQADYIMMYNQAGVDVAVWIDIDADGTVPTGAKYVASTHQVEVDIATGATAATNATAFKDALELEANYADVTIVDNFDGTLTMTQDINGATTDPDPENIDDSGAGGIGAVVDNNGVTGAEQGDYISLTNTSGETLAVWLDIDAAGTAPTGVVYAASDYQAEVDIVTGGTAIANAALFTTGIEGATTWVAITTVVDNLDTTITISQVTGGTVTAADPHNTGDTGVGSITAATDTTGTAGNDLIIDYVPKASVRIIQDNDKQTVALVTPSTRLMTKQTPEDLIAFIDVTSPATVNLTALVAQLISWKDA
jgi:hypothetical protein